MDIAMIISMLEDALDTSLENGIQAVRDGNVEDALPRLERGYAKVGGALDALRSFQCPPSGGPVVTPQLY